MTTKKSTIARPSRAKSAARPATAVKRVPKKQPPKVKAASSRQGVTKAPAAPKRASSSKGVAQDQELVAADTRPRSTRGGRIGRPKTRFENLQAVPTRCPSHIYTYLRGITPFLYPSLTAMFEDMITRFLKEQPWEHGLHWRKPKTAMTYAKGMAGATGWSQVNIQLPLELKERVTNVASVCGVSNACLCYTAIFWWVQYIYPPAKMVGSSSATSA
ncbi:hypothetical protein [Paraburkholderia sacchari]|uniref:Uncharacterized protein n=1 Tax=Paraburkholderia sacchari TaxID=159450 RepID=A0A8T6ZN62_9BURK|nr:hypothetical protein [Paraburkholderia sacchari]NLP65505.1 hypothetical protein [Paraburkholderia sacchari]NLP65590.1 hypothetical protein [Paraburkholderia sacchari]